MTVLDEVIIGMVLEATVDIKNAQYFSSSDQIQIFYLSALEINELAVVNLLKIRFLRLGSSRANIEVRNWPANQPKCNKSKLNIFLDY